MSMFPIATEPITATCRRDAETRHFPTISRRSAIPVSAAPHRSSLNFHPTRRVCFRGSRKPMDRRAGFWPMPACAEHPVYFLALATDYDGTIADEGVVDAPTSAALLALKKSGRRLIMVTGRELDDLQRVYHDMELFDLIVAENGALLYNPASREEKVIAPAPSEQLIARLEAKNVTPLSVGRSIVATWEPNQTAVLEAIHELGLELQ